MNHLMVDLETFGTGTKAPIVQIGAVQFDPVAGELGAEFVVNVSLASNASLGRAIDPDTVLWWLGQERGDPCSVEEAARRTAEKDAARRSLMEGQRHSTHLSIALQSLMSWTHEVFPKAPGAFHAIEGVWSHGAPFDLPILADAYRDALNIREPWHYRTPRDTRTLFWLAGFNPSGKDIVPMEGVKHSALADAVWQARCVIVAMAELRRRGITEVWRDDR